MNLNKALLVLSAVIFIGIIAYPDVIKVTQTVNSQIQDDGHVVGKLRPFNGLHDSNSSKESVIFRIKNVHRKKIILPPPKPAWHRKSCKPVYFLASGKAGSTTLASYLKYLPPYTTEEWDPRFSRSVKEVCWPLGKQLTPEYYWSFFKDCPSDEKFNANSRKQILALDACPRMWSENHLRKIAEVHPDAKFVLIVRDPVDRLISHVNHRQRLGTYPRQKTQRAIDAFYTHVVYGTYKNDIIHTLSEYDRIIPNFLKFFDAEQLIIFETHELTNNAELVVNSVLKHFGAEPKEVKLLKKLNTNPGGTNATYPSPVIRKNLDKHFQRSRNYLQYAIGHNYSTFKNV